MTGENKKYKRSKELKKTEVEIEREREKNENEMKIINWKKIEG
jgi:hypothetical protein